MDRNISWRALGKHDRSVKEYNHKHNRHNRHNKNIKDVCGKVAKTKIEPNKPISIKEVY